MKIADFHRSIAPLAKAAPPELFRHLGVIEQALASGSLSKRQLDRIVTSLRKAEPIMEAYANEQRTARLVNKIMFEPWY